MPASVFGKNNFNPHSHKGSDFFPGTTVIQDKISIHTPTRGVTCSETGNKQIVIDFNPHSHKGSDVRGAEVVPERMNFNPHSHKGSDVSGLSTS